MSIIQDKSLVLSKPERLRLFIKDVGFPLNQAPEALGLKASDFMAWWSGQKNRIIKQEQFVNLGQYLHVNEDDVVEGTYDKNFIRNILFTDKHVLPEKYLQNQSSFLRASAHIIKFATLKYGQHFSDMIMRKMNISPVIYGNLDNKISLNYFMDLLDILVANGFTQTELDNLSSVLFLSLDGTVLGNKFKQARTYYQCFEVLAKNIQIFDTSFIYKSTLERNQFILEAFLPFDFHNQVDWNQKNIERMMRYRQILVGWSPYMSKLSPLLPECTVIHGKDGVCAIYTLHFTDIEPNQLFCVTSPVDSEP